MMYIFFNSGHVFSLFISVLDPKLWKYIKIYEIHVNNVGAKIGATIGSADLSLNRWNRDKCARL
jgi:hypothetical protein